MEVFIVVVTQSKGQREACYCSRFAMQMSVTQGCVNYVTSTTQQTLSMGPINISLRTLTISCDYLRCSVITIRLHWINSDIKQICSLRFVSTGQKLGMLGFIMNYGNLK